MLLARPHPQRILAAGMASVAGLALLTAYCQLTAWGAENVPLAVSFRWALCTLASWGVFGAIVWSRRERLIRHLQQGRILEGTQACAFVFVVAAAVALAYYSLFGLLDGDKPVLAAFEHWFIWRLPVLLLVATSVTAVFAAVSWRLGEANPPDGRKMDSRAGGWMAFPEEPNLRLRCADVTAIRTARNYCELNVEGRRLLVRVTAKSLEKRLSGLGFMRVHRGALVNLSRVRAVRRGHSGSLRAILDDGTELVVSRRHRVAFTKTLESNAPPS